MDPIKVRLSYYEVLVIFLMTGQASKAPEYPDIQLEFIILSENSSIWLKKCITARSDPKPKIYTVPISLARILHGMLQTVRGTEAQQSLLGKLDQELTNRNLKPIVPITLPWKLS